MKKALALPALAVCALALSGCVRTVGTIVTAPVKAASWTVDKATTSQSEADRNAGRKMRKDEEKRAREERKRQKEAARNQDS
ncbi:hypothetical protein HL653_09125 [Sphingomonas sp. AP4-R1]|uniref:hypothetical protein n=1 Tax=Sphingomonas sp. AP4-R1 TaxID=2735134 RepID=UPI0014939D83|nr:hypothetical protein [Sphingomonas sp. AP4-R1]QJU57933.1 hypothetical protein HL653_09125 [Sphingomonas sp. AP4-R1]